MNFWIYAAGKTFVILLFLGLTFFSSIPYALHGYERWVKTKSSKDLTAIVVAAMTSLLFISFVGVALIHSVIQFDDFFSFGVNRLLFTLILIFTISYLTVPKAFVLYHRWKQTRAAKHFSRMVFLGTVSVFAFSIILAVFLPAAIR